MKNALLLLLKVICLYASISNSFVYRPLEKRAPTFLQEAKEQEQQQYATASERFNARWNVMFERLKQYKEEHGDCLVPYRYEKDPSLGWWVSKQRKESTLDNKTKRERRDKLNSIGFVWSVQKRGRSTKYEKQWDEKFERLVQYKQEYGDCHPPFLWKEDPKLKKWISRQRALYANSKIPPDRKARLESVGFSWVSGDSLTAREKQWETMFAKLEKYYQQHGDCNVPQQYKEDPSLANWVSTQRIKYSKLDSDRRNRLEMLGFVWEPHDQQWEAMFAKLDEYRRKHGDCLVPQRYKEDPALGTWVSHLRIRRSTLNTVRRDKLDSIGFVWDARHARRSIS